MVINIDLVVQFKTSQDKINCILQFKSGDFTAVFAHTV